MNESRPHASRWMCSLAAKVRIDDRAHFETGVRRRTSDVVLSTPMARQEQTSRLPCELSAGVRLQWNDHAHTMDGDAVARDRRHCVCPGPDAGRAGIFRV